MPDRVGVVVLGMSRSGTSAVAGMFVRAGFFAGRNGDVLSATEHNARGHHENLGLMRANDRVLTELGGRWWHPPPPEIQLAAAERAGPVLRGEVERMLREADGMPIVVKDPRIGVMMPMWDRIVADELHPVLVIRSPIEISRSLYRRDGAPLPFGLAMWELHMTTLLEYINGRIVTVAPYVPLLEQSTLGERIVTVAASHVDASRVRHIQPQNASGALDPGLHHWRVDGDDYDELLTGRQRELWQLLESLPPGDQRIDVPVHLRGATANVDAVVSEETYRARLVGEMEEHRSKLAKTEAALAQRSVDAERLRAELRELHRQLDELHTRHLVVVKSRRWRVMGPPARVIAAARRRTRPRAS